MSCKDCEVKQKEIQRLTESLREAEDLRERCDQRLRWVGGELDKLNERDAKLAGVLRCDYQKPLLCSQMAASRNMADSTPHVCGCDTCNAYRQLRGEKTK